MRKKVRNKKKKKLIHSNKIIRRICNLEDNEVIITIVINVEDNEVIINIIIIINVEDNEVIIIIIIIIVKTMKLSLFLMSGVPVIYWLTCWIAVSWFELQSRDNADFRSKTIRKGKNPFIPTPLS